MMDKLADVLGAAGAWCGQNKYLSAIKNAFQNFMPLTIAGAIAVLWCNVLVNSSTGLGIFFKPIMALSFLNPAFSAVNFATISCITIGVTYSIAQEIGEWNGEKGYFPGLVGLSSWIAVTQTTSTSAPAFDNADAQAILDAALAKIQAIDSTLSLDVSFTGIPSKATGATGLFTGMIIGILSAELYCWLRSKDQLKIKMPDQVPPGVAKAFEVMVPAVITVTVCSCIGLLSVDLTGLYLNDLIATYIQAPLQAVGASIPGVTVIYILIMLFWLVGIHGNNMLSAVKEALFTPLILENIETYAKTGNAYDKNLHIFAMAWLQMWGEFGGSGVTIGLVIAILIFGKRPDNRAIAGLSSVPGCFNINETVTFGIPMVLNPILGIPFVIAPLCCIYLGYILTAVLNICPRAVINTPWTTPPILFGFLTCGANIMGAVGQLLAICLSTVIYTPFLLAYENFQNKQSAGE